jgi:hypothetical protein
MCDASAGSKYFFYKNYAQRCHTRPSHYSFINLDDSFGTFPLRVDLSLSIDILPDVGGLASGSSSSGFTLTVVWSFRLKKHSSSQLTTLSR